MRYLTALAVLGLVLAVTVTAEATSIRDHPDYVPSSNLVLGTYYDGSQTPHNGAVGWVIADPFQLNLEYQSGIDNSNIDAFNAYNPDGWPLNFADNSYYFLQIDENGNLPIGIWDFYSSPMQQSYAPDSGEDWVQWTLSYWSHSGGYFQTILAGDILEEIPDDPYLRIQPTAGFRSFLGDGLANDVEIFNGGTVRCEVLGYAYTGSLGQGTTLQPKLVPEPMTMAGLLLGVGALGGYLRRRRV